MNIKGQSALGKPTWALTMATYNRPDVLDQCLECVFAQTYMPKEIIIVDGSPKWKDYKKAILEKFQPRCSTVTWIYQEATIRSAAAQRNQAGELATSDVLFFIDDDSMMHPQCAEKVLEIYSLDVDHKVAAVAASNVSNNPISQKEDEKIELLSSSPGGGTLKRIVRKILSADNRFVPYDERFPEHQLPESLIESNIVICRTLPGFSLTCRRQVFSEIKFEQSMRRYSAGEDSDLTYRASRKGLLIKALEAHLHHVESPGGRLSVYATTSLSALNVIYLHKLHAADLHSSKKRLRSTLIRRFLIELIKDLTNLSFSVPRARGIIFGLSNLSAILDVEFAEAKAHYLQMQSNVIDGQKLEG